MELLKAVYGIKCHMSSIICFTNNQAGFPLVLTTEENDT